MTKKARAKRTRGNAPTRRARVSKKAKFIGFYRDTGNIAGSAKSVGIGRTAVYEWEKADPDFALAMKVALDDYCDKLEKEADRRAVDGFDEPVYQNGELVGEKRRYSDTLLMFRLNGLRPDKYVRRTKTEMSGPDGGPVPVAVTAADLSDDELASIIRGGK